MQQKTFEDLGVAAYNGAGQFLEVQTFFWFVK